MDEWRQSTWGDEVDLNYGKAIRGYKEAQGKYQVFGSNGPIGWWTEYISHGPGVILGRKGAYRGVQYSKDPFYVIDTAFYVVPKAPMNMRWLYYAIIHHKLGEIDDGSPIPSTTRSAVYVRHLSIPELGEQNAIANTLSILDDKIELNRRTNETLEAMAQAIFKDWFVDFGPVRRKMQGETDTTVILGRLINNPEKAATVAALFPETLADSGVPLGWENKKVEKILDRLPCKKRYTKKDACQLGNTPIYEQGTKILLGFHDGKPEFEASPKLPMFIFGDHTCVTKLSCKPFSISQNVIPVVGAEYPTVWTYYAVQGLQRFEEYRRHWSELINKEIVAPTHNLSEAFSLLVLPLIEKMEQNESENQSLAQTRDYLLPQLISGEVRIANVEAEVA